MKNIDYKLLILAFLLALGIMQSSCVPARMALSEEVKQTGIEMPVYGRQGLRINQHLSFGPYQVYNIHRGWIKSHNYNIFFYNKASVKQDFEFTLADADSNIWEVAAAAKVKTKEIKLSSGVMAAFNPNKFEEIAVSTLHSDKYGTWNLLLTDKASWYDTKQFEGALSNETQTISLRPVSRLEGGRFPMDQFTGIEFVLAGKTIGAVELLNSGRVYMQPDLQPDIRMALAGASAYLLLADNLKEELDRLQTFSNE